MENMIISLALSIIIFFTHIVACIWHAVAFYNEENVTWLDVNNLKKTGGVTRYLNSIYWAVSVMVTISNEHLKTMNNGELAVGVIAFLASSIFFGFAMI